MRIGGITIPLVSCPDFKRGLCLKTAVLATKIGLGIPDNVSDINDQCESLFSGLFTSKKIILADGTLNAFIKKAKEFGINVGFNPIAPD